VASGKGGVGKSTVAVNLAFALAARGARVGLLDADIQGPSLPTMVKPASLTVRKGENDCINPLMSPEGGVACASYGWVSPRDAAGERRGAAMMRGPLLGTTVRQLTKFTAWGARDTLLVDTPPGTGDVHLTLGQLLPFTGAVVVTTPQAVAMDDTDKGLQMLKSLAVPPLALVLNQAYFKGADGVKYYPLGRGEERARALANRFGIPSNRLYLIPMEESTSVACDSGVPLVISHPGSQAASVFSDLARDLAGDLEKFMASRITAATSEEGDLSPGSSTPEAFWDSSKNALVVKWHSEKGSAVRYVEPRALRLACRCASCVDEISGIMRINPGKIPLAVVPIRVESKGNYGVAVGWSDGHDSSIFTFAQLKSL